MVDVMDCKRTGHDRDFSSSRATEGCVACFAKRARKAPVVTLSWFCVAVAASVYVHVSHAAVVDTAATPTLTGLVSGAWRFTHKG